MKNYIPKTNDLIIFSNKSSGILSDYDNNNPNYKWSESIVSIDPNQSALVLDSYYIDHPSTKASSILVMRKQLILNAKSNTNIPPRVPKPPTILVVSLNNIIIEILYDPDVITPFPHPTNLIPPIKLSTYLMMAR